MMEPQWFVLDLNPEPWAVGPLGAVRKGGVIRPFMGKNQQLDDYKKAVQEAVKEYEPEMVIGKVKITCLFWRHQTPYTTAQARAHRKHEADATNMLKATEDALQGVVYVNDKDNNEVHGYIMAQGPDVKPRVIICVEQGDVVPRIIKNLPLHVYKQMERMDTTDHDNPFSPENWNAKDGNPDPSEVF